MSSNGALLNEERGTALLDAGLQRILINVGDEGDEYESVYQLPFEKTRDNVVRFVEMAGPECAVQVVLVDYQRDPEHMHKMERYWREHGVDSFLRFDIMNRGGALFVDHMQFESYPQLAKAARYSPRVARTSRCAVRRSDICSSATTASTTCVVRTGRRRRRWAASSTNPSGPSPTRS